MIGKTVSHYTIMEELGRGGMGVVYKARDLKLDRIVALKFLSPHFSQSEEQKKRFVQEAKAASALDHPNICSIYDIDETEDGQLFISMGCYQGEVLKNRIERSPLDVEEAKTIAMEIAAGLKAAHDQGIIHRDIKPANIMIGTNGQVKILDFGLAKVEGSSLTKEQTSLGTLPYMSPEQLLGKQIDYRTDIWSFAILLFEMVSGKSPFDNEYEQQLFYQILNEDPKDIFFYVKDAPFWLNTIITKSLLFIANLPVHFRFKYGYFYIIIIFF